MTLSITIDAAGYGRGPVVSDVELTVERGQVAALLGPNGAGKSTTLTAATGGLPKFDGQVRIDTEQIHPLDPHRCLHRGIAHVPEGRGIFSTMTVADNLELCVRSDDTTDALRDALLDRFPILRERSSQRAGTLSGGEQQMLAIARALMARPDYLLIDEPSLGLAPVIVDSVFALLRELCDRDGLGVLLAEQTQEVMSHCDTAYILTNGQLAASGTRHELAGRDLFALYVGDTDTEPKKGAEQ